jgi:hypothetical protein
MAKSKRARPQKSDNEPAAVAGVLVVMEGSLPQSRMRVLVRNGRHRPRCVPTKSATADTRRACSAKRDGDRLGVRELNGGIGDSRIATVGRRSAAMLCGDFVATGGRNKSAATVFPHKGL